MVVTDRELNIVEEIPMEKLYIRSVSRHGFDFFEREGKTMVADSSGKVVAEINVAGKWSAIGDKLYCASKNCIIQIDIDQLTSGLSD